ncbi:MAG: DUF4304 domain-containing protein [Tabrizicola sp.]
MDADRKTMETALKQTCVPVLREMGFKGSFPNFCRETGGFVALVNFQFYSAGDSFCVNLGYADPERRNVYHQPETPPGKLQVSQTSDRVRLGEKPGGDNWFSFGPTTYGEVRGEPMTVEAIVTQCTDLLRSEAEGWWAGKERG